MPSYAWTHLKTEGLSGQRLRQKEKGSKDEFLRFIDICNENEERIKVTYEVCKKEAIFLDVKVTREIGGKIKTLSQLIGHGIYTGIPTTQGT